MGASAVLTLLGVACTLGVAVTLAQQIGLARSHRNVSAMAARAVALVVVLAIGTSMVAAPGAWASAYDGVMGLTGQR